MREVWLAGVMLACLGWGRDGAAQDEAMAGDAIGVRVEAAIALLAADETCMLGRHRLTFLPAEPVTDRLLERWDEIEAGSDMGRRFAYDLLRHHGAVNRPGGLERLAAGASDRYVQDHCIVGLSRAQGERVAPAMARIVEVLESLEGGRNDDGGRNVIASRNLELALEALERHDAFPPTALASARAALDGTHLPDSARSAAARLLVRHAARTDALTDLLTSDLQRPHAADGRRHALVAAIASHRAGIVRMDDAVRDAARAYLLATLEDPDQGTDARKAAVSGLPLVLGADLWVKDSVPPALDPGIQAVLDRVLTSADTPPDLRDHVGEFDVGIQGLSGAAHPLR